MSDGNVDGQEELVGWSQWNFSPLPWVTHIFKPYSQTVSLEVYSLEGGRCWCYKRIWLFCKDKLFN